jgi:hypothetical protein
MVIAVMKLIFFPPGTPVTSYNPLYWWIMAAVQVVLGILALYGFSRLAGAGWFGKAERAILVDRQVILVRNVHGGRGTIEGEARTIKP